MDSRAEQRAHCLEHIVPIWDRWSDRSPAARQLLLSADADRWSQAQLLQQLNIAVQQLHLTQSPSAVVVAKAAAAACSQAIIGIPAERFHELCRHVWLADARARWEHAR